MFQFARALSRSHEVHLFACGGEREAAALANDDALTLYASRHIRNNDLGAVPPVVSSKRVRRSCPRKLANDLLEAHTAQPFDGIVIEHSYAAATALRVESVPRVIDEHNVESAYQEQYDAAERRGRGRLDRREIRLLSEWEHAVWSTAALVTCVSDADAGLIRAHRTGPVEVVSNGASLRSIPFALPSRRTGRDILFVGLMSHAPNVAAARFLARDVMPRVWAAEPAARLVLCGRSPSREVHALARPGVEVTGTVPSVVPYLERAAVYANALAHGAGSSLKVPEAMAAGIPLISTDVGVRGFPIEPGEHYARATSPEDFAAEILRVLRDRSRYDTRAERAHAVAQAYGWDDLAARFAALATSAIESSRSKLATAAEPDDEASG